ncbi:MAG: hypothetical protein WCI59_20950, partial [Betaproteobacteria bacterium]
VSLGDLLTSLKNLLPSLPGVSLTLPDFGGVNWDTIRLPNLGVAFPDLQIDWAQLSLPEFLFALPRLNLPGLQLSFDFSKLLPDWPDVKLGDLAFPDVSVDWAQLNVLQFLFKLPQMELPGLDFGLFGIELPELPILDGLIGKLPFDLDLQNLGFRIFGDLDLAFGDSFVLSGRFGFEKLPNWLSVVGQDIDLTLSAGGFEVGALDANLGLVIDGDGIAFEGSGALHADLGGMATLGAAQATVFYNSTGKDWTGRTLTIGTVTHTFGRLGADDLRGVALDDASLTIADFVQAEGDLVVRDSVQTLKLADGSDLDAKVLSIGGSALTGFAGLGAGTAARTGLALSHLEIAAALATDRKDATRRWTSLQAQGSAAFVGVDGLVVSADAVSVEVNRAARDGSLVDYAAQGLTVVTGTGEEPSTLRLGMDAGEGALLRATGNLQLDVFGFVQVAGGFGIEKKSGSIKLADKAGTPADESATPVAVDMLLIGGTGLQAFAGLNGGQANATGLALQDVDFALAVLGEKLAAGSTATARKWTSLQADVGAASLVGVSGLTASVSDLSVQVNRAAADGTVVDYADGATALTVLTGPASELELSIDGGRGQLLRAEGHVALDVFGFVQLEGDFAFDKASAPVALTLSDGSTAQAQALKVGASNLRAFAGINGGTDEALGLELTGVDFGLALLSEVPAQGQTTAARSWTSLQASAAGAAFTGVDGLQVSADTITIEVNRASTEAGAVVDYGWKNPDNQALGRRTELSVATGPASSIDLAMDGAQGRLLRASGNLELDVFGFFQVSGGFAIESRDDSFFLNDGVISEDEDEAQAPTEIQARVLTIGGSGVQAFVGLNGGTANAKGLSLADVDFGLLLASEKLEEGSTDTPRNFTTLKATAGSIGVVGLEGFTASASDLSVEINRGVPGTGGQPDTVLDHGLRQYEVASGPDSTITLDSDGSLGELTRASGNLTLDVLGFVQVQGFLSLQKSTQTLKLADQSTVQANLLAIGGSDLSGFVGIAGEPGQRIGLAVDDVEFALALLSDRTDTTRSWTSLQATAGQVAFEGVSGLTMSATNLSVAINQAGKDGDRVVDYAAGATTLAVTTDAQGGTLNLSLKGSEGEVTKAAGHLDVDLFGFFSVQGGFGIEQRHQDVVLSDGSTIEDAQVITIGGSGINAFAGINAGTTDAVGLSLGQVDFGLALIRDPEDATRRFTSLQASAGSAAFSGITGLTVQAQQVLVNLNQGITLAAQPEQTIKVNTELQLAFAHDFVGTLKFNRAAGTGYGASSADVQIGRDDTEAQVLDKLKAGLQSLQGVGTDNVRISGNRVDGYVVEFVGALSGVNVADITASAQSAATTYQVQTAQTAQAGVDERKQVVLQALREEPAPVSITVSTPTDGQAGVDELNTIVFTAPRTAGQYTVYLVSDGLVQQQTAAVAGTSEVQRLTLVGDTQASAPAASASVTQVQPGGAGASAALAIVFKAEKVIQEYDIFLMSNPAKTVRAVYRGDANVAQTISEMRTAYATLLKDLTGGQVKTSAVQVELDTAYSGP